MRNKIISSIFIGLLLVIIPAVDAKVLPRFSGSKKAPGKSAVVSYSKTIGVSARLRSDRKALNVTFTNLKAANNVSYTLTYKTDGKDEGVSGSIDVSLGSTTRELLFGTCSSGVCRYQTGLSNMRLEIVSELTSGKKSIKYFKVKI